MDVRRRLRWNWGLGCVLLGGTAVAACGGAASDRENTDTLAERTTQVPQKVPQSANPYTLFETLQVRPLAISPDGERLYALNTPDNRLEVYGIQNNRPCLAGEVEVGLEPVAVAVRSNNEVWVVNHLSDSVSIVDDERRADPAGGHTRCYVGDEPRDIVFAGPRSQPRLHHDRAPRPELAATIPICSRRAWPRGRLGLRREQPRNGGRRSAADEAHVLRRHARARSRRRRTARPCTRRRSSRATRRRPCRRTPF